MVVTLFILQLVYLYQLSESISIEQWETFEVSFNGPSSGNPFKDVELSAQFIFQDNSGDNKPFNVNGFYDGNGIYRIRFMPNQIGLWKYNTKSNIDILNNESGSFDVIKPSTNNNGPIFVDKSNNRSFIHANGKPFFQTGTTSYAWIHQYLDVVNTTLNTLRYVTENNIFNKIRMLVFPKWYEYTHQEPIYYPYIGTPPSQWGNFDQFNVSYWQHLDRCLQEMLQIERDTGKQLVSDLIIFHPYDNGHWGFDCMGCPPYPYDKPCRVDSNDYDTSNDLFYMKYLISRVASYRHVWWSMANEFDHVSCKNKSIPQAFPIWDQYFNTLIELDPYRNPRKQVSIHNGKYIYNYSQPYMTHFSVQGYKTSTYQYFNDLFNRNIPDNSIPVILDEVGYEGNISSGWCQVTSEMETDRFWQAQTDGIYCGHAECILPNSTNNPDGTSVLWWNYGGQLRGQSYKRIGWFNNYMSNENIHPRFSELINECLVGDITNECAVGVIYKEHVYYLVHWSAIKTGYNTNIELNVGNNDKYQISQVDQYNETIKMLETVNGPVIQLNANYTPFDLQIINTNSVYFFK